MNKTLLPPNATFLERNLEAVQRERLQKITNVTRSLRNPDVCDVEFLPWLAWALSVDYWDSNWSEDVKRKVIKASFEVHQKKGTLAAVCQSLATLDAEIEVKPGRVAHSLSIEVLAKQGLSETIVTDVKAVIDRTKALRTFYEINLKAKTQTNLQTVAAMLLRQSKTTTANAFVATKNTTDFLASSKLKYQQKMIIRGTIQ
jgi:phage tail P2-like protein